MKVENRWEIVISGGLRVLTLGSKLLFILILGWSLPLSELGLYGLMASFTSYAIYFIGFETHSYVNRLGIGSEPDHWHYLISKQLGLFVLTIALFIPSAYLLSFSGFLDKNYFIYFILITLVEHFGQESYRTLIALRDQLAASILLFVRSALWTYIIVLFVLLGMNVNIDLIFKYWFSFGLVTSIISYLYISIKFCNKRIVIPKINFIWMINALKTAFWYLLGTLILRFVQVFDRYLVGVIDTKDALGLYVFYTSLAISAGAVFIFLGPSRIYPQLILAIKAGDGTLYRRIKKKLLLSTIFISTSFFVGIPLSLLIAGKFSDNPLFKLEGNSVLLGLVMCTIIVNALNLALQYILYSHGKDKEILYTNILSFLIAILFLCGCWLFNEIISITIVVGVIIFYILGCISKVIYIKAIEDGNGKL